MAAFYFIMSWTPKLLVDSGLSATQGNGLRLGIHALFRQTNDGLLLRLAARVQRAPDVALPALDGLNDGGRPVAGFATADLAAGSVTVVNFWA